MRAPLNGPTSTPRRRASAIFALVAVAALLLAGCGDDGDETTSGDGGSTETTAAPSTVEGSTEAPSSDTTASTPADEGTTSVPTTGSPGDPGLSPGDPCSLEEGVADCIDPDGDGEGVYLTGGAECVANAPDPVICEDLDGDGHAGYPDEYSDLPTCSADVPPPCNNPPGSEEE